MEPRAALRTTELRYCTAVGDEVVTNLADVELPAVVNGAPVREFSWHPRQGNYPGWLWTATTGTLVGYESLLERDRVLLADFEAGVNGIVSQPFWISGVEGSVRRRHAPDYLLTCEDSSVVVVDVKPAAMCKKPEVAAVLDWTGRLCRAKGWRYEIFHGEDPVLMANLRFLAHGRRSMFLDEECVAALAATGRTGMPLGQVESLVVGFDPADVRASALGLLWRQAWTTDLHHPLSSRSVITTKVKESACLVTS